MLSRREKLYKQPWEERRYKDHRSKVQSALPAIDNHCPPTRSHVIVKLKKIQRETDRTNRIENENFSLLQRLNAIMKVKRLDNHWTKPLPNFQHKVGRYHDVNFLNNRLAAKHVEPKREHQGNAKCYACEFNKMKELRRHSSGISNLPSLALGQK